jgi:hypothetical protein
MSRAILDAPIILPSLSIIGETPVTMLIPADRPDEEPMILERISRGERIDNYETIRQRKDGSLIDISLTGPAVTPPKENQGFGEFLIRTTVTGQLGGEISQDWKPEGLVVRLSIPRARLTG